MLGPGAPGSSTIAGPLFAALLLPLPVKPNPLPTVGFPQPPVSSPKDQEGSPIWLPSESKIVVVTVQKVGGKYVLGIVTGTFIKSN
jgi:hypothetical protein